MPTIDALVATDNGAEEFNVVNDVPPTKKDYLDALKAGEIETANELYAELNPVYN